MSATDQLNRRSRRALESICDTFAPGGAGLPSATELGVPDALLELVSRNPRASERKQVGQLLGLWDTRLLTAVTSARTTRRGMWGACRVSWRPDEPVDTHPQ